jgi:hypothetical protein
VHFASALFSLWTPTALECCSNGWASDTLDANAYRETMTTRSIAKRRAVVAAWALAGAASSSSSAHAQEATAPGAPTRLECVTLHEKSQELRKASKLLDARKALRFCSNEACPTLIRKDCTDWLEEVERAMPSVAFEGVLNGKDATNVRVSEGDRVLAESLTGGSYELDPGVHKFQATMEGHPPIDATSVIREGEKNRVIRLDFTPPVVLPPPSFGHDAGQPTGPRPVPAAFWVFGAAAVATAGVGTAFGVLALQKRDKLTSCSPFCVSSDTQPVKTLALVADIGFGATVVSAALATYFLVTRPVVPLKEKNEKGGVAPTAIMGPGLGGLGVRGSF